LKKTGGVYATRAIITPSVFSHLMLSNAILFISLWWIGFFRMAKSIADYPFLHHSSLLHSAIEKGVSIKEKKERVVRSNENQRKSNVYATLLFSLWRRLAVG
jgi:hypothetical protein